MLLEPMRRDSGPAIAAGAAFAQTRDKDAVVLALAADHVVADTRSFRRRLPRGAGRRGSRAHRDVRRAARARRHRIWLHQSGRGDFRRGPRGREIRREAGRGDGCGLCQGGLSLEQRQLHVPRRRAARRIPQGRCRQASRPSSDAVAKAGTRSRLRQARRGRVRIGEVDLDRLRGDGKDRARRGGAGRLRLVRCRLLACGVGIVRQGRQGQRRAGRCGVRGFPQLQRIDRPARWSRSKASTISWWSRPRTRCWCRGKRTPTG